MRKSSAVLLPTLLISLLFGCAIDKMAVQGVTEMLASGDSTVFTGEEDPVLVGEALPFALKLYESLLESAPENRKLLLTTGQAFVLYAYAYVQMPADMLPDEEFDAKLAGQARAKKLFLRARKYILSSIELAHPGFIEAVMAKEWDGDLAMMEMEDVPYLYWAAMSWFGALTADFFDMELLITMPRAAALMLRVLELDADYDDGAVHEFLVSYYGGIPKEIGGSEEKAREHYARAVELSGGLKAGPHVALATTVCVNNQDVKEFRDLLEKALEIDVDEEPRFRLMNILAQKRASWLLERVEDYFLITEEE
jgi:predicted anti-sigma-YlaC factor YlaD